MDRPAGQHREIVDPGAGLGQAASSATSHACCLRRLLAAMASPVVPMFERAARPFGPVGSTVTSKSKPLAKSTVWYRQCPPSAIAARPEGKRSIVDMNWMPDGGGGPMGWG